MSDDEYLDVVDDKDVVKGSLLRSEIYQRGLSNFRVVNAFVVNAKGQIWIPRRSADKRIFPLCLDMSMGGHVQSGESYFDAFGRELHEELNMIVADSVYKRLGKLCPAEHGVSAFMEVYEIKSEGDVRYNRKDFTEAFWLYPNEVLVRLEKGDKSKDDLPVLIRKFYPYKS